MREDGINSQTLQLEERNEQLAEGPLLSDRRFRILIENSADVISLINGQGEIMYKSPSITRMLGFSSDELVGVKAFELAHPDDLPYLLQLFTQVLKYPERHFRGEFRHRHKNGGYRWVEGDAVNMLADPEIQAIVFNYRDITARKEAEASLKEAQISLKRYAELLEDRVAHRTAQLEESLHALEAVLYHVAHDLRAPLRAIDGYTTILLDRCADFMDPKTNAYGRKVSEAASRMDELIGDLLDFGRLGHLDLPPENVDLNQAVASVMGRMSSEIEAKGARISVAPGLPCVRAHSRTLQQIIQNLVNNAVKFVAPGVTPEVRIWARVEEGRVRLCVQDNGIGISAEYQEKIFRIFERLHEKSEYPGTGIGLAIVRKAAERMGGTTGVDSEPSQGSCFWVELAQCKAD